MDNYNDIDLRLGKLEQRFNDVLDNVRSDLKDIKQNTNQLTSMSAKQDSIKDALDRAFKRIEALEEFKISTDAMINQLKGAKILSIIIWSILASGLGSVIIKVFF
jgi:hypothetical protein